MDNFVKITGGWQFSTIQSLNNLISSLKLIKILYVFICTKLDNKP